MDATPNQEPDLKSRVRQGLEIFAIVVGTLLAYYVIFYWGFWRGGKYVYNEVILPYWSARSAATAAPASSPPDSGAFLEVLKVVWAVVGATAGGFTAAVVRRWFVFHALEGKVRLVERVRLQLLQALGSGTPRDLAPLAITAGTVKYLFGEKEYVNIGKYMDPAIALMLLRTISAMDMLAGAARLPEAAQEIERIRVGTVAELERFNLEQVLANLKLLQSDGPGVAEDAAEKATA